jgi:hypothetical protein
MKIVYLDLDGVVADFNKRYREVTGVEFDLQCSTTMRWGRLKGKEMGFYGGIPTYPEFQDFVSSVKSFVNSHADSLQILTALPSVLSMPTAAVEKMAWCGKYLPGLTVTICPASIDKQVLAKSGDILVDDNPRNVAQWMDRGGIAIRHINFKDTLIQLGELAHRYL